RLPQVVRLRQPALFAFWSEHVSLPYPVPALFDDSLRFAAQPPCGFLQRIRSPVEQAALICQAPSCRRPDRRVPTANGYRAFRLRSNDASAATDDPDANATVGRD